VAPAEHAGDPRWNDAHLDRVVLVPTAETHPAGTWYVSSYEILLLQAGYALTDRTQLSLTMFPYFTKDPLIPLDLSLKGVLVRSPRVRVAAMGSFSSLIGYEGGAAALGRLGGVTQLCFDDSCRSSVSTAANLLLAGGVVLVADGVGAVIRTSDLFAFLIEAQSVLPLGGAAGDYHALAGALGFRLSGRAWAVDLAFETPLDHKTNPQVIPVLAATYRFLP
jgi:hypothetical protein